MKWVPAHAGIHHRSLGAYFTDLPPNMLGSFLMGLFAASGMLGLPQEKELVILPKSSSWQVNSAPLIVVVLAGHEHCPPLQCMSDQGHTLQAAPELHIGLRTGYCGSLTTFASWEYSLVTSLIGGAHLPDPY